MSDGYEGREIAFRARKASQSGLTLATWTTVTFSSSDVTFDDVSGWNGTDTYTVRVSGKYRISGFAVNPSTGSGQYIGVSYRINGGSDIDIGSGVNGPAAHGRANFIDIVNLKAGDTVQFRVISENTTTVQFPTFIIERISSPQTIAMGEVVAARYTSSSGQSIPDIIASTVNFNTKEYDTHNAVTTGTNWKFTAPVAGTYHVSSYVMYNSFTISSSATIYLSVDKNNVYYADISRLVIGTHTNTYSNALFGSTSLRLNAGDTINIKTFQSTGSNRTLFPDSKYVWVAIHKIS
jgi:hypothetical protein